MSIQINDSSVPYSAALLVIALTATWFLAAELTNATTVLTQPEPEEPVVRLDGVVAMSQFEAMEAGDAEASQQLRIQLESRETLFRLSASQLRTGLAVDAGPPVAPGDSVYMEITTEEWSRHPDAPRARLLVVRGDTLTRTAPTSPVVEWTRTSRRVLLWLLTAAALATAVFAASRLRDGIMLPDDS